MKEETPERLCLVNEPKSFVGDTMPWVGACLGGEVRFDAGFQKEQRENGPKSEEAVPGRSTEGFLIFFARRHENPTQGSFVKQSTDAWICN